MQNQDPVDTIERLLRAIERQRVDAAFARMADDAEYQAELLQLEQELSPLSDEAWQLLDRQHPGVP
jgi:hypothetical protein